MWFQRQNSYNNDDDDKNNHTLRNKSSQRRIDVRQIIQKKNLTLYTRPT